MHVLHVTVSVLHADARQVNMNMLCSTLLNAMFGTNLSSGLGKVTSGIHLQLIPCPDRDSYDYIMLMDTEGLRYEPDCSFAWT